MRKGWREGLIACTMLLWGVSSRGAQPDGAGPHAGGGERIVLALELAWATPEGKGTAAGKSAHEVKAKMSEGRVDEVVACPPTGRGSSGSTDVPEPDPEGGWRLGGLPSGRVRLRVTTALAAELIVRRADQVVRVPVASILERKQHTPAQSSLDVTVERLAWDAMRIELGQGAESAVVKPGAAIPLIARFNLLWPEASEVVVRTTLTLRPNDGGEPIWKQEHRDITPANRSEPQAKAWAVPAPASEGMYQLEVQAAWEPAGPREGTRLGRLIRRRKAPQYMTTAIQRLSLAVLAPHDRTTSTGRGPAPSESPHETEVDAIDLARVRNNRFTAWGRAPASGPNRNSWEVPAEVIQGASRRGRERERLLSRLTHAGVEPASLGPVEGSLVAWSAVALRVTHPEKPHRLTVTVTTGEPSALGAALIDPGDDGRPSRLVLDACASGPPVLESGPAVTFSWLVWPGATEPILLLLNRNPTTAVRLGTVRLAELELPPGPIVNRAPDSVASRGLGLYLNGRHALDRFNAGTKSDQLATARNIVGYMSYCGSSLVVLGESSLEAIRKARPSSVLEEEAIGPDPLELILRELDRHGYSAWLELAVGEGESLPGLPPPGSSESARRGLVRVNRRGQPDGATYQTIHPDVRAALCRKVSESLTRRGERRGFSGVLVQLGPGATLLGTPDTGIDDDTYTRFVRETFGPDVAERVPGLGTGDPGRFAARSDYLAGVGRMPWLNWRARAISALYGDLSTTARNAAPGAVLVVVTPRLDGGAAGAEARRVDLAGLAPSQAWRSVGLDLETWTGGAESTVVLRGVGLSNDALAHDLATSPDLDHMVASRSSRGVFLAFDGESPTVPEGAGDGHDGAGPGSQAGSNGSGTGALVRGSEGTPLVLEALPLGDGALADEPLGHALAALDAHWVIVAAPAVAGREERLRRFATTLRSIPALPAEPVAVGKDRNDYGIVVRRATDQGHTYLEIANDTPYPLRLASVLEGPETATVDDLSRGLRLTPQAPGGRRQLVLDLLPFGVSAIRIGAPGVQIREVTPYPSEAMLVSVRNQFNELSGQLARLNRGMAGILGEPANPGFEPSIPDSASPRPSSDLPGGWRLASGADARATIEEMGPHGGKGCLGLVAPSVPAAVISGEFVPSSHSGMLIQAFFRSDRPDAKVRVWIEGEAGGQPYLRRSVVTVGAAWEARAVRASDLPAGGLDSARLRFELLTPGTLWVDDLRVHGDTTPKAVRLNAQRTLLAAIQAYRDQRFAEFARLASSHWARHPSVLAATRLARSIDPVDSPVVAPRPVGGQPSALPDERRLR